MNFYDNMKQMFREHKSLALATCIDNKSNVRLVGFCTDEEADDKLYFATFIGSQKTKELAVNNTVAFTTVPCEGPEHVRVNGAKVLKSSKTVYDLVDKFAAKDSEYALLVENAGASLEVYEIHFKEACVITAEMKRGSVNL